MNDTLKRLKRQMLHDKKKLGLMIGLVAVGLLMWGRLLLEQVPETATASPAAAVAAAGMAAAPPPTSARPIKTARVQIALPESLARDPFALDPERYPMHSVDDEEGGRLQLPDVSVAQPKSGEPTVDTTMRSNTIRNEAMRLRLQSVIDGPRSGAIINDTLLVPGKAIEGFTLKSVQGTKVVLEKDGLLIRLGM